MHDAFTPKMNLYELGAFLESEFPQMNRQGQRFLVEAVEKSGVSMRMIYDVTALRPGGTISGPAMFALADIALYAALLAQIGPRPLAVTTSVTINFLRKPPPGDMIGKATILKLGKRLAVGEIRLRAAGHEDLAAHATATYSIPNA